MLSKGKDLCFVSLAQIKSDNFFKVCRKSKMDSKLLCKDLMLTCKKKR